MPRSPPVLRFALLTAALVLTLGCGRGPTDRSGAPGGPEKADPAVAESLSSLPKLQPKTRFKLPGERLFDAGCVQLTADGKRLAVTHKSPKSGNVVQIWDLSDVPTVIAEFPAFLFALSPSGRFILSSDRLEVYDVASKKPVAKLSYLFSHAFFRDDTTVVTTMRSHDFAANTKGKIVIWDVSKNSDAGSFEIPDNRFEHALPAKNGKEIWLFMGHNKFEVECYDLDSRKLVRTIKPEAADPKQPYTSSGIYATIASDGSVFGSNVSRMHFYEGETGKIVGKLPLPMLGSATGFLPGGFRYLASVSFPEKIGLERNATVLFDWKAQKPLAVFTGHATTDEEIIGAGSVDGKVIVRTTRGGDVLVYDTSALK